MRNPPSEHHGVGAEEGPRLYHLDSRWRRSRFHQSPARDIHTVVQRCQAIQFRRSVDRQLPIPPLLHLLDTAPQRGLEPLSRGIGRLTGRCESMAPYDLSCLSVVNDYPVDNFAIRIQVSI
jgi:hypothetical protein